MHRGGWGVGKLRWSWSTNLFESMEKVELNRKEINKELDVI